MQKTVFLSGEIGNLPDFGRSDFIKWMHTFIDLGYIVLHPGNLPSNLPEEKYIPIALAMIDQADCVFMSPGWANSETAKFELMYAQHLGKEILYDVP